MKNFESMPHAPNPENNEQSKPIDQEKRLLLEYLFNKYPKISRKALGLMLILMNITGVFAPKQATAQESFNNKTISEQITQKMLSGEKLKTPELKLPPNIKQIFALNCTEEMSNNNKNSYTENKEGSLSDSGENFYITSRTWHDAQENGTKITDVFSQETIIGQTGKENIETLKDTLHVSSIGETKEIAIARALQSASEIIGCKVTSEKINVQESSNDEEKNLFIVNNEITSSTYIYKYKVTNINFNEEMNEYSVTLEVIPGKLIM